MTVAFTATCTNISTTTTTTLPPKRGTTRKQKLIKKDQLRPCNVIASNTVLNWVARNQFSHLRPPVRPVSQSRRLSKVVVNHAAYAKLQCRTASSQLCRKCEVPDLYSVIPKHFLSVPRAANLENFVQICSRHTRRHTEEP